MRRFLLLFIIGLITLFSLAPDASAQGKKKKGPVWSDQRDDFGDPLPIGAVARIGTMRYRLSQVNGPQTIVLSPDGKLLAALGADDIEVWELPAWKRHKVIRARNLDKDNPPQLLGLAISPDGKKLVTFDADQQAILLLDIAAGKAIKKMPVEKANTNGVPNFTLLRDGQTLVASFRVQMQNGMQHHVVQIWDLAKGKLVRSFRGPMDPSGGEAPHVISFDGRWFAHGAVDANANPGGGNPTLHIEIWDLNTGKLARKIVPDGGVHMQKLALSPNGKWLAAANGLSLLRIYDAASGKETHNIRMRRAAIDRLEFSPDSASLYVADELGKITHWDPIKGEPVANYKISNHSIVTHFAFAPEGKVLALGMDLFSVNLWDVAAEKRLSPTGVPEGPINVLSFSSKGELFVAAEDGMSAWWNPRTGRKLRDLTLESLHPADREFGLGAGIRMGGGFGMGGGRGGMGLNIMNLPFRGARSDLVVNFARNGEFLMTTDDGSVGVLDAKTGKVLYDIDTREGNAGNTAGNTVTFLDDGNKAAAIEGKKVRIWNTRSGRDLSTFSVPWREKEYVLRMDASPNGKFFAFFTANNDGIGRLVVWDVDNQKPSREFPAQGGIENMQFSPDNQWIAVSGENDRLRLVRLGSKRSFDLTLGMAGIESTHVAFSPDGRQLACAALYPQVLRDSSRIFIYELASKKIRLELGGHPNAAIDRLAYAHDRGLLATGSADTTVLVWNAGLPAFLPSPPRGGGAGGEGAEATADELTAWFQQMAGTDARAAFQGMIKLARTPKQTVKLFADKIAAAKKPDAGEKPVAAWVQDLSSGQFAVRSKANAMLQKIGATVEPDLLAALPKAKDVETKRRIEELLEHFATHEWTPAELLHGRAVEVLEAIATPESRAQLTRWSEGDAGAVLTGEARRSLTRLNRAANPEK